MSSPSKEIKEYNKLGICMKDFANYFGMVCACDDCIAKMLIEIDLLIKENKNNEL